MLRALRDGYLGILDFRGRMALGAFWIYTGVNIALTTLVWSAMFSVSFQQFAASATKVAENNPEDVTIRQGPGSYSISVEGNHPDLMPDMTGLMWTVALLAVIFFALTVAAAIRRLHDSGRSGAWVFLPVPFLILGFVLMPDLLQHLSKGRNPPMAQFALLFANNLIYLLCLLIVAVLLGLPGNSEANRYGPPSGKAEG